MKYRSYIRWSAHPLSLFQNLSELNARSLTFQLRTSFDILLEKFLFFERVQIVWHLTLLYLAIEFLRIFGDNKRGKVLSGEKKNSLSLECEKRHNWPYFFLAELLSLAIDA